MERDGSHQARRVGGWLGGWLGSPACLVVHCGLFLLGATLLTMLNLLRSPGEIWFWRPLAWWGALLVVHAGVTLGGVLRGAAATPPEPRARPASAPRSPEIDRLARALGAVAARTGAATSAWVGGGAATVARQVRGQGGERSADTASADTAAGWSAEDDAAFASWARATNTWRSSEIDSAASNGHADGWSASSPAEARPGRQGGIRSAGAPPSANGAHPAGARAAASPDGLPTPSGRFRTDLPPAARSAATTEVGTVEDAWVPAAVEALWGATPTGRRSATNEAPPTTPSRPATAATPALDGGSWSPSDRRPRDRPARDVVLSGPVPVDPNDPQWTRLEAAAEAWLAGRGPSPAPTPLPAPPLPTGSDGAAMPQP